MKNYKLSTWLILLITCFIQNSSYSQSTTEKVKDSISKVNINIDLMHGVFVNKTFGIHPTITFSAGIKVKKNLLSLIYEKRYLKSKTSYIIDDNSTKLTSNAYDAEYYGLEYMRDLIEKDYYQIKLISGIGFDNIYADLPNLTKSHTTRGTSFNLGFSYAYLFKKKHGPRFTLLYHHSNLKDGINNTIDSNSLQLKIGWFFNNEGW